MNHSVKTDCAGTAARHFLKALRLSDWDADLLRLSARGDASPGELASLYAAAEFDALDARQIFALSALSQRLRYRGVPEEYVPRVQGVFRFHSVMNAARMKDLLSFLRTANGAGARVTLLDGAAVKAHYLPETVRWMGDFRLRIGDAPAGDVLKALAASGEFTVPPGDGTASGKYGAGAAPGESLTAVVLLRNQPGVRFFCRFDGPEPDRAGADERDRALETVFRGERVFVPSREALLFQILSGVFQTALRGAEIPSGRLQWAMDCAFLTGEDGFGRERFRDLRRQDGGAEILIMLKVLQNLFPALVPEEAFSFPVPGAAERKRTALFLRYFRTEEELDRCARDGAGKRKFPGYCFRRLRLYWYRNRCLGKRPGPAADLLSFPSFLRSALGAGSGRELIGRILDAMRETI